MCRLWYSGSPVNHVIAEQLVTDIYGGEEEIKAHLNREDATIDNLFRSNATPEDAVAGVLGYNGAGINSSENLLSNMGASFIAIPRLFGVGDPSPHSYYPCVIGCGNDNYTPDIRNYYTPNRADGKKEYSRMQYYQENFIVKDKKGQPRMTIDTNLLPSSSRTANTQVVDKVIIDTARAK